MDHQPILDTAIEAARAAGALALRNWHEPLNTTQKGYRDLVTNTDVAAQQLITGLIRERFPDHGIVAEEDDLCFSAENDIVWIIDPIDGTSNYAAHIPVFAVAIGVAYRNQLFVGVVYDPVHDDLYSAVAGHGSWRNGQPLHVSNTDAVGDAMVALDWSRSDAKRQQALDILGVLAPQVRTIRAIGSAALALTWIATGQLDAYFNINLKAWDIAAAGLIVQEAGGEIGSLTGCGFDLRVESSWQLATNGTLHAAIIDLLNPDDDNLI